MDRDAMTRRSRIRAALVGATRGARKRSARRVTVALYAEHGFEVPAEEWRSRSGVYAAARALCGLEERKQP